MAFYRHKPVVVEAIQFDGKNLRAVLDFTGPRAEWWIAYQELRIQTTRDRNGEKTVAEPGDWIIKGVGGEFYPIKAEIFEVIYEPTLNEGETATIRELTRERGQFRDALARIVRECDGPAYGIASRVLAETPTP